MTHTFLIAANKPLLCITGFAAWIGAIALGKYRLDDYGGVAFGFLFGIAIFFTVRLVLRGCVSTKDDLAALQQLVEERTGRWSVTWQVQVIPK